MHPFLQKYSVYFFLFIATFFSNSIYTQPNLFWTGGGDGTNWEDANNWENLASMPQVPDETSFILIGTNGPESVTINSNTKAETVVLLNSQLTVKGTLELATNFGTGIALAFESKLFIKENATINIKFTGAPGIIVGDGLSVIENKGNLIFGYIGIFPGEGVNILCDFNGVLNLTNTKSGKISGTKFSSGSFMEILTPVSGSRIVNYGLIETGDILLDGFLFKTDTQLDNYGTINLDTLGFNAFFLVEDSKVINKESGKMIFQCTGEEGVFMVDNSEFTNNGQINFQKTSARLLTGGPPGDGEQPMLIDPKEIETAKGLQSKFYESLTKYGINWSAIVRANANSNLVPPGGLTINANFTNNGPLDLSIATGGFDALIINPMGTFNNTSCGILNIKTPDIIDNQGGILNNEGIITTVATNNTLNTGTINHTGIISTPNGSFPITGNPLIGSGKINNSPIPAILALCNFTEEVIPTMSQWGLLIFGLLLLNLSLVLQQFFQKEITEYKK